MYRLPWSAPVRLEIYDLMGQKVRILVDKAQEEGYYQVKWNGRNEAGEAMSSGLYLYRLQAGPSSAVRKLTLLK